MSSKVTLEEFLFKPLYFKIGGIKKLIVIFGSDTNTKQTITPSGKKREVTKNILHAFDIDSTIIANQPIIQPIEVSNFAKFKKNVVSVQDVNSVQDSLQIANSIILHNMQLMTQQMQVYGDILSSLQNAYGIHQNRDQGNLIIGSSSGGMAHIVFKTVTGNIATLKKKEIEKIGGVILEVIKSKVETDLSVESNIQAIKHEIEFKTIESLPNSMKAGDIHINMDAVVEEIAKLQGSETDLSEDELGVDINEDGIELDDEFDDDIDEDVDNNGFDNTEEG